MIPVTMYRADDGALFASEAEAKDRDQLIRVVNEAMKPLGSHPENFRNGNGYIQHRSEIVAMVRASLIGISRGPLKQWMHDQETIHKVDWMTIHPSWFCRMLDGGSAPLERAWHRLCCIDNQNREFDQPYYVEHPDEANGGCLNP